MKRVKTVISIQLPNWSFCNSDNTFGDMPKQTCRFCQKTKTGYRCMLYDEELRSTDHTVEKTQKCCRATAGVEEPVYVPDEPTGPVIDNKQIIKLSIDLYAKTLNDLLDQGIPAKIAQKAALDFVMNR